MVPRAEILELVWAYKEDPPQVALKIVEKVGEVAECILKRRTALTQLGYELADVVICCQILAELEGLDLAQALRDKWYITRFSQGISVKAADL